MLTVRVLCVISCQPRSNSVVVLIEVADGAEVLLDNTSDRYRWISTDPEVAKLNEEDRYVVTQLERMKGWQENFTKK